MNPPNALSEKEKQRLLIAIDGPTASGKGTIARRLAAHYGLHYLDTGSLYRAVAVALLDIGACIDDEATAVVAAQAIDINKIDPARIRSAEAGAAASVVAAMPKVRAALFDLQRNVAADPQGAVLDGRDIGTVICPDAKVKLYVTASEETRTRRRLDELNLGTNRFTFDEVLAQVRARDDRDQNRAISPAKRAEDSHLLDTTSLSIEAAVEQARAIVDKVIGRSDQV